MKASSALPLPAENQMGFSSPGGATSRTRQTTSVCCFPSTSSVMGGAREGKGVLPTPARKHAPVGDQSCPCSPRPPSHCRLCFHLSFHHLPTLPSTHPSFSPCIFPSNHHSFSPSFHSCIYSSILSSIIHFPTPLLYPFHLYVCPSIHPSTT